MSFSLTSPGRALGDVKRWGAPNRSNIMNKIVIALAATTAFAGAAPAAAQYGMGGNGQIRSDQLQMQLQAGVRSGAISRAEAMPLREQLMQLTRLERLYARDGISGRERADLQQRINRLRQGIRMAERTGDGRYDRDDRYGNDDDRYDRDDDRNSRGNGDSRFDRDNDRWDDRDANRDGRWDNDDGYGRDQASDRGTVGRIIDRVTGTGGLRVGQRASGDLGAVPYAYRNEYRDGPAAYYRSDGRQIYQIDPRTQTVVRIYAMTR
jgi:hypothetical protein